MREPVGILPAVVGHGVRERSAVAHGVVGVGLSLAKGIRKFGHKNTYGFKLRVSSIVATNTFSFVLQW